MRDAKLSRMAALLLAWAAAGAWGAGLDDLYDRSGLSYGGIGTGTQARAVDFSGRMPGVYGNVQSNDLAMFADRTGLKLRGTNMAAAVAAGDAANAERIGTGLTGLTGLVGRAATEGTNYTDAAVQAEAAVRAAADGTNAAAVAVAATNLAAVVAAGDAANAERIGTGLTGLTGLVGRAAAAGTNYTDAAVQAEAAVRAAADGTNAAAVAVAATNLAAVVAEEAALRAAADGTNAAAVAGLTLGDALRTIAVNTQSWVAVEGGTAWVYTVGASTTDVMMVTEGMSAEKTRVNAGTYRLQGAWIYGVWVAANIPEPGGGFDPPASISWDRYASPTGGVFEVAGEEFGFWWSTPTTNLPATVEPVDEVAVGTATFTWAPDTNRVLLADSTFATNTAAHLAGATDAVTRAWAEARYLGSTPGWWWQGSQVLAATGALATVTASGGASGAGGIWTISPMTDTWHNATGVLSIAASRYIVDVTYTLHEAPNLEPGVVFRPMHTASGRTSPTNWIVRSSPGDGGNGLYYTIVSNLTVWLYDRADMAAGTYTNDAAGIVARADAVDVESEADDRRLVNVAAARAYVDARKTEIADHAWDRTPGGRDVPDRRLVTIDEPLVQQGAIAYLQSGDSYVQSYEGGDWYSSPTGSTWRIGPAGTVAFEIAATNRLLHIEAFAVAGGVATIDISTNWIAGPPRIEFSVSLLNQQWLACPSQTMTNEGAYWRGQCPAVATSRFYRAVSPGGSSTLRSHYAHEFLGGITLNGTNVTSWAGLKALLNSLP